MLKRIGMKKVIAIIVTLVIVLAAGSIIFIINLDKSVSLPTKDEVEALLIKEMGKRIESVEQKYGLDGIEVVVEELTYDNTVEIGSLTSINYNVVLGFKCQKWPELPDIFDEYESKKEYDEYGGYIFVWGDEFTEYYGETLEFYDDLKEDLLDPNNSGTPKIGISTEDWIIEIKYREAIELKDSQDNSYYTGGQLYMKNTNKNIEETIERPHYTINCQECNDTGIMYYSGGGSGPCVHCDKGYSITEW